MKKIFKNTQAISVMTVVILLYFSSVVLAKESLEYQLACIDSGWRVSKDYIIVARFRSLLRQLSNTYVENKQQIADTSVTTKNILREKGISESLMNIMEGMNQLFYTKIENQKYAEYMSVYVVLRNKGQSHKEAILGLKAILQSIGVH